MDIGARLRAERERIGLTQEELAEAAGVDRRSQVNYESGERLPKADYLAKVAAVGIDTLFVVTNMRAGAYQGGPLRGDQPATVLTAEESVLVNNYRAATEDGKRALEATGLALAKSPRRMKPTG